MLKHLEFCTFAPPFELHYCIYSIKKDPGPISKPLLTGYLFWQKNSP
jgi:hypothetical protein